MNGRIKKATAVFLIFSSLAAGMMIWSQIDARKEIREGILRDSQGGSVRTEQFTAKTEDGLKEEFEIEIQPREYSTEESSELIKEASSFFNKNWLGNNPSAGEVTSSLKLPETLMNGQVTAEYSISQPGCLSRNGEIMAPEIPQAGIPVTVGVTLKCGNERLDRQMSVLLCPPDLSEKEQRTQQIGQEIVQAEASTRQEERFALPKEAGGIKIQWSRAVDYRGLYFLVVGAAAAACILFRDREKERKMRKQKTEQLMREYPNMAVQFAMLMGAGMTAFGAWERLVRRYETSQICSLCMQEMQTTYREMKDGCPEKTAYEKFADRIGLFPYRKFAALLVQNMQKGTGNLLIMLEQEADQVLEQRKNTARRLGEEAGTKLLMPMMLMLVIVLVIIMIPAVMEF